MGIEIDDRDWYARLFGRFVPPDVFDFARRVAPAPEAKTAESLRPALSQALFNRPIHAQYAAAEAEPATNEYVERLSGRPGPGRMGFAPDRITPDALEAARRRNASPALCWILRGLTAALRTGRCSRAMAG